MKMNRLIATGAAFALTLSMAACTSSAPSSSVAPASSAPAATDAASSAAPTADGAAFKIAIYTSPNGVDDGSFNENNYDGVMSFIAKNPQSTVTHIQETTGDPALAVEKVAESVADYDVLVCTGFQFGGITDIAKENPDKKFILIDSFPAGDAPVDNIFAIQFAEQESGFFAGMAAALETKTGKVAVVNGVAFPSNVNYQYGFECGVKYVNETEGKTVEVVETGSHSGTDVTNANVGGNYTGDFGDEAKGKELGKALIDKGCDIIFVAAGGSGNGVFTAAKEAGNVFVIGCDVDQYNDGVNGDKNIILTSALKVMDINVDRALQAVADGSFKGGNYTMTATTDSTGYVKETGRQQLSAETIQKLDAAYELVKSGAVIPASNFGGFTPDEFTSKK